MEYLAYMCPTHIFMHVNRKHCTQSGSLETLDMTRFLKHEESRFCLKETLGNEIKSNAKASDFLGLGC